MEKLIKWELIRIRLIAIVCKKSLYLLYGADHDAKWELGCDLKMRKGFG
jgi:hypothetical protein